ncbi:AraC-type DNA-binding protein [Collimonas sp. OK607]|uniref:AraC family transcriptional regulator n=1 Tax=Collimonas sp. OK607 TaxID=1798194 RepID=UPI0008E9F5C3|nr:AraC family transcriptional regulator [Collimonas sp. OK607]SFA75547.1 AraC-type DNA-binding protein [Collimonas sp. OK607]
MTTLVRSVNFSKYSTIARGLGIDPVSMIQHVGLDQTCFLTPDLWVPEASLAELLEASARATNGASIGLLVGESWRLSDFGVISLLLQHQPTLRHALTELKRYRHLLSDSLVLDLVEYPTVTVIQVALVTGRASPGRQPVEMVIGALLSLCRHQLGSRWLPRSVHFSHPAPNSMQIHQRVFHAPLEFGSEFDGIVLSKGDLDQLNPLCDPHMAGYAKDYIDLQPRNGSGTVTHDVRRALHVLLPRGENSIQQVGQSLGVSPRTLQRQLEHVGANFQSLLNDVRREQAMRYLNSQTHSILQIAALLGFAETSVFSRWFSTQFGMPPSRWKKNLASDGPQRDSA